VSSARQHPRSDTFQEKASKSSGATECLVKPATREPAKWWGGVVRFAGEAVRQISRAVAGGTLLCMMRIQRRRRVVGLQTQGREERAPRVAASILVKSSRSRGVRVWDV